MATEPESTTQAASPSETTEDTENVCRAFRNRGVCNRGDDCKLLHTEGPKIEPPPRSMCNNFAPGGECKYGDRCRFRHGEDDPRFDENGRFIRRKKPKKKKEEKQEAPVDTTPVEEQVCKNYLAGKCRFGEKCRRIHQGEIEQTNVRKRKKKAKEPKAEPAKAADAAPPAEEDSTPVEEQVCRNYLAGKCRYGEKCRRIHQGEVEQTNLKKKKKKPTDESVEKEEKDQTPVEEQVCKNYLAGKCRYGEKCRRIHQGEIEQVNVRKKKKKAPAEKKEDPEDTTPVEEQVCNNYLAGKCRYGDKCRRIHQGEIEQTNVRPRRTKKTEEAKEEPAAEEAPATKEE